MVDFKIIGKASGEVAEVDGISSALRVGLFDPISGLPNPIIPVKLGDSDSRDGFGKLRISNQTCVWSSSFWGGINTDVWETGGTNNTSVVNNDGTTSLTMTTNASGNWAWIQSYIPVRYEPGQSRLVRFTFSPVILETGQQVRIGAFSDDTTGMGNGVYLEMAGNQVNVVRRYYNGTTTLEERIAQNFWNQDTFTGTDLNPRHGSLPALSLQEILNPSPSNPSNLYLNWGLHQHLIIDYQYLGVGRIRFGFDIGGQIYWSHYFDGSNALSGPWCETGSLPLRAEVRQTAVTSTIPILRLVNCAAFDEGNMSYAWTYKSVPHSQIALKTSGAVAGTPYPLVSFQLKNTNNSTKRAVWVPMRVTIGQTAAFAWAWGLAIRTTGLTGATFATTTASNVINIDTAATAMTLPLNTAATGYNIAGGVYGGAANVSLDLRADYDNNSINLMRLTSNAAGTTQYTATLYITPLSANAVTAYANVDWRELW